MLIVDRVSKTFNTETLPENPDGRKIRKQKPIKTVIEAANEISFKVEPGDIFGFLGPNGA